MRQLRDRERLVTAAEGGQQADGAIDRGRAAWRRMLVGDGCLG